ncbi:hypothetical protein ACFYW6_17795 [Streptomyces sp. NPDC002659]|uniref:hypothetical protein n=1 Tax=Streptomyces sp. NPDC002659 TaxID=3364656 RepID=UPI0036A9AF08
MTAQLDDLLNRFPEETRKAAAGVITVPPDDDAPGDSFGVDVFFAEDRGDQSEWIVALKLKHLEALQHRPTMSPGRQLRETLDRLTAWKDAASGAGPIESRDAKLFVYRALTEALDRWPDSLHAPDVVYVMVKPRTQAYQEWYAHFVQLARRHTAAETVSSRLWADVTHLRLLPHEDEEAEESGTPLLDKIREPLTPEQNRAFGQRLRAAAAVTSLSWRTPANDPTDHTAFQGFTCTEPKPPMGAPHPRPWEWDAQRIVRPRDEYKGGMGGE